MWTLPILIFVLTVALAIPLGLYMAGVFDARWRIPKWLSWAEGRLDTGLQNWIQLNGAPRYLQWDVTFDASYQVNGSVPPSLSPESPLPILEFLRIPFSF